MYNVHITNTPPNDYLNSQVNWNTFQVKMNTFNDNLGDISSKDFGNEEVFNNLFKKFVRVLLLLFFFGLSFTTIYIPSDRKVFSTSSSWLASGLW